MEIIQCTEIAPLLVTSPLDLVGRVCLLFLYIQCLQMNRARACLGHRCLDRNDYTPVTALPLLPTKQITVVVEETPDLTLKTESGSTTS